MKYMLYIQNVEFKYCYSISLHCLLSDKDDIEVKKAASPNGSNSIGEGPGQIKRPGTSFKSRTNDESGRVAVNHSKKCTCSTRCVAKFFG